ncbi:unannotated protein [freshwater metagenome]|uniref:Unannotated protein n=1 Tax=freshwater metagenome TaxID=449393 RepID=A0A6J6K3Y2_9ZZZZ
MHPANVRRISHETERDKVAFHFQRPAQILFVLLGQCGSRHRNAGKVNSFVVRYGSAHHNGRDHIRSIRGKRLETDLAVINEERVPGFHIAGKPLIGGSHKFLGALNIADGDGKRVSRSKHVRPVHELLKTNLWALKVHQYRDGLIEVARDRSNGLEDFRVDCEAPVAEIHTDNVDSGFHQSLNTVVARCCWPQCCHNLRASHAVLT